ncbi:HAD family phosphatase [Bradyrhizobium lablabi]|uniref:HAD family hydrolase n=1 Tax=Bradyrhizobium lablabi TaxID=722472 RepID=UPI0028A0521F|nr:HAD family phosphatase [Bradyrhizobium lablabi]
MSARWAVHAVLLDMDGTLIDTEKVYFDSLVAALNAHGYTDDVVSLCNSMVGLPGPACEALLLDRYGAAFPLAAINQVFLDNRDAMIRAGLPLKTGALELLDGLAAADCPMAIVTSSSRRSAERNLTLAGIRGRFDTLLTLDDVTHGKPDPELYLKAASSLGVTARTCVAVEDSNHGVAAAHAAGTITLMVPDLSPPTEETRAKCAAVLPDLSAVLALLRERGALMRKSR